MTGQPTRRIFDEARSPQAARPGARMVYLPWKRTLAMCLANISNRRGRFLLTLICVTVTVAFLMSSVTYHGILADLSRSADVHTRAVLERAGTFTADPASMQKQEQQRIWILALSAVLCVTGITNTMLMSVAERSREIGTLKCLGALNSFILRLFLVESLMIGTVGGIIGTLSGYVLGVLQAGARLEFSLLSGGVLAGPLASWGGPSVAAGALLTMASAIYPTYVAAWTSPVEAMRAEV